MSTAARPLRVALLGSRGIPGALRRLRDADGGARGRGSSSAASGHRLLPLAPGAARPQRASRRRLVVLPTIRTKHLDTPVHTLLSSLHAAERPYDAALVVNSANALFVPLLRAAGIPVALHVDGIEKRRAKWGAFGRAVYALSERLACVVADEAGHRRRGDRAHYRSRYGAATTTITYGVDARPPRPATTCCDGSGSRAGATSSTSAASSPRTTRIAWSRPIAPCPGDDCRW